MRAHWTRWAAVVALVMTGSANAAVAHAEDGYIDELKLGVLKHDVPVFGRHKEGGVDLNGELLFKSPRILDWAFAPRPHLGVSVNTDRKTDQAYAGLTWTLFKRPQIFSADDSVFTDFAFGGAIHDGHLTSDRVDEKQLGSRVLFRESLEIGYEFQPRRSVSLYLDHESDAGLTEHNDGLTNAGIRLGYGF